MSFQTIYNLDYVKFRFFLFFKMPAIFCHVFKMRLPGVHTKKSFKS